MIDPKIVACQERKLVGMHITTSLTENRTKDLWQGFRPRVKEIFNRQGHHLISVQDYGDKMDFGKLTPATPFRRWAAVEVNTFDAIPRQMQTLILPSGKFAVYTYKGTVRDYPKTARYFFKTWLPNSAYELDGRPHFEILGEKYLGPLNPDSEEEIWIPVINLS